MNREDDGFIFLVTLLMIAVISLLVVTSMQHILLYYKAINQQEEAYHHFYQLEKAALQLGYKSLAFVNPNCILHEDSANQVLYQLIHHKGCSFKSGSSHYTYFIEDLGGFPCLVTFQEGKKQTSYHKRVSMRQMDEEVPGALLQIRFIRAGRLLKCANKEHFVALGVSSWRYVP